MKVVLSSWNTLTKKAFGMHSIGQYMEAIFASSNTLPNQVLGVHSIGQYMKVFFPNFGIVLIKYL
jgi:hypothetical protein